MYEAVAEAFLAGLEERIARGEDISRISSVASFFVSRIDTRIDEEIDARVKAGMPNPRRLPRCAERSRSPTPSSPINIISS